MCELAISENGANRLYWLGRYTERAYLSLHMLRRYFDLYLDGNQLEVLDYERKFGRELKGELSFEDFASLYIFDKSNESSIMSILTGANDNAILLREIIKSESLSYIQMSICLLEKLLGSDKEITVTSLQKVTDYLLAFFGSIEERLFCDRALAFVRYGRCVESLDMHMRFDYDFESVRDIFERMLRWIEIDKSVINQNSLEKFNMLLSKDSYAIDDPAYKNVMLETVNSLVIL